MRTVIRLLRQAIDEAHEAERGLDFRWNSLNQSRFPNPDEDMTMDELDQRSAVLGKATADMNKILDALLEEVLA